MRARVDSDASLQLDHHLLHHPDHVSFGAVGHGQGALLGGHLAPPWLAASLRKPPQVLLLLLQRLLLL